MIEGAEVIVIGGGVVGASALYHLTKAGCTDVVLCERETLGSGSTSKAAGGIRAQFADELNIAMALENIRRFEMMGDELGVDIDYKRWGYMIMHGQAGLAALAPAIELQHRMGVPTEVLTSEQVGERIPQLHVDDLVGATFCPLDGYATPETVVQGYAATAIRSGARVLQGCPVTAIATDAGRVTGVETGEGTIATRRVVLAAGVWSVDLAAGVGLDLPVKPEPRHVWLTSPGDPLPHNLPLTIDFDTGFYFQREGDSLLFGGRQTSLEELAPVAVNRLPVLAELGIRPGWWGYYEMTPDHNAVIGTAGSVEGLWYATGFSGHGFQQAPVVGEHLAELALDRSPTFDLAPLSVERFQTNVSKPETLII